MFTKKPHRQTLRAKRFFRNFSQNRKKTKKKRTNRINRQTTTTEKKIQKTTFSWKNRVLLKDYNFENRNEYRQNRYQDKNRDYDKKRYKNRYQDKNKYRNKFREYERSNVRFQDFQFQKTYNDSYEYEDSYANDETYEKIDFNKKYDDEDSENQYAYNLIMKNKKVCKKCGIFKKKFNSNNLFHAHIRGCRRKSPKSVMKNFQTSTNISNLSVIKFTTSFTINNDLNFRNYHFVMIWIMTVLLKSVEAMTNTECAVFFINKNYFRKTLFNENVIRMIVSINVKNIKNVHKKCDFYVFLDLYLNDESKKIFAREYFRKKIHVIKNLKCKLFFEMNILEAKQIIINLINKIMIIFICKNLIIFIKIVSKPNARIWRVMHFKNQTVIFFKSITQVFIYMKNKSLSNDRNYFFEFDQKQLTISLKKLNDFYIHICHDNVTEIHVKNDKNMTIKISRRVRLNTLTEYETKDCYQIDDEYHEIVVISNIKKTETWFQNASNNFIASEPFHESELRVWFQNIINNSTIPESFHDDFLHNVTSFELLQSNANFSNFSHFFTIIREI